MLKWPLAEDSFTFLDRLKVAGFVLNSKNQLTMGPKTKEFERKMAGLAGTKYAVATSSGSTANHAIFELYKQQLNHKIDDMVVIVPSTTWISSITPAIMAGFKIHFVDINLDDFCFDYEKLETSIIQLKARGKQIILFPTALIGFNPDFYKLQHLARKYNTELWLDSCENTLSLTADFKSVLSHCRFTTTSCYFSHQITSVEAGFVFMNDPGDYERLLMIRNHGLSRALPDNSILKTFIHSESPNIDKQFLFAEEGTNFRTSDIHSVWGLLDFERKEKYAKHRREMYSYFYNLVNKTKYYIPPIETPNQQFSVPFCLPIFKKSLLRTVNVIDPLKKDLNNSGIETRPIIGGNLLYQPIFKNKEYIINPQLPEYYENSDWLHKHGLYIGLTSKVTKKKIDKLVNILENY